jgi:hypothetical protein
MDIIEAHAALAQVVSELGREMDMPPGAPAENVLLRVGGVVQEIAELAQEHGVLSGRLKETERILRVVTKALYRATAERDLLRAELAKIRSAHP